MDWTVTISMETETEVWNTEITLPFAPFVGLGICSIHDVEGIDVRVTSVDWDCYDETFLVCATALIGHKEDTPEIKEILHNNGWTTEHDRIAEYANAN